MSGGRCTGGRLWTADEDDYLRAHYSINGAELCARYLHRTETATVDRARYLHLKAPARIGRWSAGEEQIVRSFYRSKGGDWCAERLGRTKNSVQSKAGSLGLTKRRKRTGQEKEILKLRRELGLSARRCHDCGKPTPDYRCPACLAKWRRKHGVAAYAPEEPYEF